MQKCLNLLLKNLANLGKQQILSQFLEANFSWINAIYTRIEGNILYFCICNFKQVIFLQFSELKELLILSLNAYCLNGLQS